MDISKYKTLDERAVKHLGLQTAREQGRVSMGGGHQKCRACGVSK